MLRLKSGKSEVLNESEESVIVLKPYTKRSVDHK